jgi:hypothetical protein
MKTDGQRVVAVTAIVTFKDERSLSDDGKTLTSIVQFESGPGKRRAEDRV